MGSDISAFSFSIPEEFDLRVVHVAPGCFPSRRSSAASAAEMVNVIAADAAAGIVGMPFLWCQPPPPPKRTNRLSSVCPIPCMGTPLAPVTFARNRRPRLAGRAQRSSRGAYIATCERTGSTVRTGSLRVRAVANREDVRGVRPRTAHREAGNGNRCVVERLERAT